MTANDELLRRARGHADLLGAAARDPYGVPNGVCIRLATLLSPEEVVWVGVRMAPTAAARFGTACLLTAAHVVLVTIEPGEDRAPATRVEAWSRTDLQSLEIPGDPDGDAFESLPTYGWPRTAKISLRYEGREDALVLPLGDDRVSRESFAGVLPSLMADLAQRGSAKR